MPNEGISRRLEVSAQRANCLNARMHKMGRGDTYIAENLQGKVRIRRLTEIECARLQGFPDDWNKYGVFDGEVKEISSTQRYKQYGNAVTATIVKKIGERLLNNAK